ncbi:TetR/AcrR family transcriptional regulator [Erysipelothrix sp. HDW6C]|uniref:TetR/AcrR family transcriptional regulator n=1 Tax=Erysipelothrix sp. HDW6C TaxID=2714930 RepID=UPI00140A2940|nr:TetR/AcrR family transcriptional regulator [Erysipelothrix sp. HDW6C]QIK70433.1 TetR/AcrR family transcriptional regulator [Erysipelothrix sp. HDW6C]
MNKYEKTTIEKKDRVLQSALTLFSHDGYGSVSIAAIAKDSRVSQASIYNYFGGKEGIVDGIINTWMSEIDNEVDVLLKSKSLFTEKMAAVLKLCDNAMGVKINNLIAKSDDARFIDLIKTSISTNKQSLYLKILAQGRASKSIDETISDTVYLKFINAVNTIEYANGEELELIKKLLLHGMLKD